MASDIDASLKDACSCASGWDSLSHRICSESYNWTYLCSLAYTDNWRCCGQSSLDYVLPSMLWLIYIVMTIWFIRFTGILADLSETAETLHDIQTQALGVVIAWRKQSILGKEIMDPRRQLMLMAMWSELVCFSFIPVQLLFYAYNGAFNVQVIGGWYHVAKLSIFTVMLVVVLLPPPWTKSIQTLREKMVTPLVLDTCHLMYMYGIIDFGGCANGMENFTLWDGTTCGNAVRYWTFASMSVLLFAITYWRTLMFKYHLNDEVYAVRFRFQPFFSSIMSFTRLACCLAFFTTQKLLLYVHRLYVFLGFSLLSVLWFGLLLYHNYKLQPCLGVGLFPNNLRSLSFATAMYTSFLLLVLSLHMLIAQRVDPSSTETSIILSFTALYPFLATATWILNDRRAQMFNVPHFSLDQSLVHRKTRVRAIAAVCVTLDIKSETPPHQVKHLIAQLYATLKQCDIRAEGGMLFAYTCQAMCHLWYHHFVAIHSRQHEFLSEDILPIFARPNLWPEMSSETSNRLSSSSLLRWHKTTSKSSRVLGKASSSHHHTSQVKSGILLHQLVDKASEMTPTSRRRRPLPINPHINVAFAQTLTTLARIVRGEYCRARTVAARSLYELYRLSLAELTVETMLFAACTLCGSSDERVAMTAAETVVKIWTQEHLPATAHACRDQLNLQSIGRFLRRHGLRDRQLLEALLSMLTSIASNMDMMVNPASVYCDVFVSDLLVVQQYVTISFSNFKTLDQYFWSIHTHCQAFQRHSLTQVMSMRKQPRITIKVAPKGTSVVRTADPVHSGRLGSTAAVKIGSMWNPIPAKLAKAIEERQSLHLLLITSVYAILDASDEMTSILTKELVHEVYFVFHTLRNHAIFFKCLREELSMTQFVYISQLYDRLAQRRLSVRLELELEAGMPEGQFYQKPSD